MAKVVDATNAAVGILCESGFGVDEARRDVSVLARHVLGWSLTDWAARNREAAPASFTEQLNALARRRATREPVAYITGVREFYGREFQVTPEVLIPRPETETLIDIARQQGREGIQGSEDLTIVDVGTGSGCIAITLKLEWPSARLISTDVSAAALDVACANAERLGARVEFVETSLLPGGVLADMVVSNPPYVPERDRASLSPDVRDFEPGGALFAGADGLDIIRALVPAAGQALKPGGRLLMEIGQGQDRAVAALVTEAGLDLECIAPDLQGIPRIVIARRGSAS